MYIYIYIYQLIFLYKFHIVKVVFLSFVALKAFTLIYVANYVHSQVFFLHVWFLHGAALFYSSYFKLTLTVVTALYILFGMCGYLVGVTLILTLSLSLSVCLTLILTLCRCNTYSHSL